LSLKKNAYLQQKSKKTSLLEKLGGIMKTYHILYNNAAGGHEAGTRACVTEVEKLQGKIEMVNLENFEGHKALVESLGEDDVIVICGGDGTINHYINALRDVDYDNQVLYYPGGSGNDFFREIKTDADEPICIDKYIEKLPVCTVNDKEFKFINGIGYGIDGYCCEVGDKLRLESDKPINYTSIAIKGLLFHYKPTSAKVTVDGTVHEFK
jgi:diacylglycerol kinase family enzyme